MKGIRIEPPVEHRPARAGDGERARAVLPFRVDELTRGVDPVKLYEYIALGKPVVASHWPGLDRFGGFVTFYRDAEHLVDLLRWRSLVAPPPAPTRGRIPRAAVLASAWRRDARRHRAAAKRLALHAVEQLGPADAVQVVVLAAVTNVEPERASSSSRSTLP